MKKIIYVTGCLGFIGSVITRRLLEAGHYVIGVDKETYAANLNFLSEFKNYKNFKYQKIDITDLDSLIDCDIIINTAAETHVDNSIIGTNKFIKSNILGVENLLNLILTKKHFKLPTFIQFSTDEVYGDISEGKHKETDILKPSNPYSASKAAADMLVLSWGRTYKIPYVIVRPTNNYGIGQYTEKFIPKSCKNLFLGKTIPLHEQGTPIRTWLHVEDTAGAILTIINKEITNEIYNISGNYECENIIVIKKVIDSFFEPRTTEELYQKKTINYDNYLDSNFNRIGQDVRYSVDDSKLKELGWLPIRNFDLEIKSIVQYYKQNFIW